MVAVRVSGRLSYSNTGLYADSPALAQRVIECMGEGLRPANSCRALQYEGGDLYWITAVDGADVRYTQEPETAFGQCFIKSFIMTRRRSSSCTTGRQAGTSPR